MTKYKDFEQWYNCTFWPNNVINDPNIPSVKDFMHQTWDTALNNIELEVTIGEDPIAVKIKELLTTINDAELIDCTCNQKLIKGGYRCACGRGRAVMRSGIELGIYLKKLREGMK